MADDDDAELDDNAIPTMIGVDKDDFDNTAKIAVNPDSDGAGTPGIIVEVSE